MLPPEPVDLNQDYSDIPSRHVNWNLLLQAKAAAEEMQKLQLEKEETSEKEKPKVGIAPCRSSVILACCSSMCYECTSCDVHGPGRWRKGLLHWSGKSSSYLKQKLALKGRLTRSQPRKLPKPKP